LIRVAVVGECMLEVTHRDDRTLSLGFAGDTFNTAAYLARTVPEGVACIDFVTAVGDDWYSEQLLQAVRDEGIGTGAVRRLPGRTPGVYLVRTDAHGERSFTYHRSDSPARELFDGTDGEMTAAALTSPDLVFLTAITLQILPPASRERLWSALEQLRAAGGRVAFDSNYRKAGWPSPAAAREAIEHTWRLTDVALPSLADERELFDDPDATACAERLTAWGVTEVVVKDGPAACLVRHGGASLLVPAAPVERVVDTTAAGDSFNGGYLAARLSGAEPEPAARAAHRLAAQVIGRPGAGLTRQESPL
jgi:2-dehydro-3-deoxygluconokinase